MISFKTLPVFLLLIIGNIDSIAQASTTTTKNAALQISTFDMDVTPPIGYQMAFDPVVNNWDMGLRAKGIVLIGAGKPIVLLAVDWIGIYGKCHDEFRRALAAAAGTVPERVTVHTIHQHDAPRGLCDDDFVHAVIHRLEMAVIASLGHLTPITEIGLGEAEVYEVASNRRIMGEISDTVSVMRWTSCTDPELRAKPEGVIDPMVSLVSFWNDEAPVAVLSFYATHPQSYYRTGIPNPDFPGIARFMRQLAVPGALHVHFTGAGGNIAAGKYNDGSQENRAILAERLADGMKRAWEATQRFPVSNPDLKWEVEKVFLPCDSVREMDEWIWVKQLDIKDKQYDLQCLALKGTRILFMPGELFVEYQLAAKSIRPDLFVAMAAYGDMGPRYIPTAKAFSRGGYECSRSATKLLPGVESVIMNAMYKLLHDK